MLMSLDGYVEDEQTLDGQGHVVDPKIAASTLEQFFNG
jgi:hypothetical protein